MSNGRHYNTIIIIYLNIKAFVVCHNILKCIIYQNGFLSLYIVDHEIIKNQFAHSGLISYHSLLIDDMFEPMWFIFPSQILSLHLPYSTDEQV